MLLESAGGQFWAKPLGEVVFVDGDVSFVSAKGFKKRRGDVTGQKTKRNKNKGKC